MPPRTLLASGVWESTPLVERRPTIGSYGFGLMKVGHKRLVECGQSDAICRACGKNDSGKIFAPYGEVEIRPCDSAKDRIVTRKVNRNIVQDFRLIQVSAGFDAEVQARVERDRPCAVLPRLIYRLNAKPTGICAGRIGLGELEICQLQVDRGIIKGKAQISQ